MVEISTAYACYRCLNPSADGSASWIGQFRTAGSIRQYSRSDRRRHDQRPGMMVAIVHYWLVGMRGSEKVLESLCRMFPETDTFIHIWDPDQISPAINAHRILETTIARLSFARSRYQIYFPFMLGALESRDLNSYDPPPQGFLRHPRRHI